MEWWLSHLDGVGSATGSVEGASSCAVRKLGATAMSTIHSGTNDFLMDPPIVIKVMVQIAAGNAGRCTGIACGTGI
jgi:hypothetical protein